MKQLETPILFIVFNRPEVTKKVFEQIRKAKPKKLFVAADGPRPNNNSDQKLCNEIRTIVSQVDWPCEYKTLFQEHNRGCGIAPSSAINWFFEHVDEGIILEDDCLPSQSFFSFCHKLLKHYRYNNRVFHIGGTSYHKYIKYDVDSDYYFIRIPRIWGWATWKRAWDKYDFFMKSFPQFKSQKMIQNIFFNEIVQQAWKNKFEKIYSQIQQTNISSIWDAQWVYTCLSHNGLCITPTKNLLTNIGFGSNATHTTKNNTLLSENTAVEINVDNLVHPTFMIANKNDEQWVMKNVFDTIAPSGIIWETKKLLKKNFPWLKKHG